MAKAGSGLCPHDFDSADLFWAGLVAKDSVHQRGPGAYSPKRVYLIRKSLRLAQGSRANDQKEMHLGAPCGCIAIICLLPNRPCLTMWTQSKTNAARHLQRQLR